jgi:hypothetical protein
VSGRANQPSAPVVGREWHQDVRFRAAAFGLSASFHSTEEPWLGDWGASPTSDTVARQLPTALGTGLRNLYDGCFPTACRTSSGPFWAAWRAAIAGGNLVTTGSRLPDESGSSRPVRHRP